jgi:hypothetical protein
MKPTIPLKDKLKILELHKTHGVVEIVELMDFKYHDGTIDAILRERIMELESTVECLLPQYER